MGYCVMDHFVMGRFVLGRFVCESKKTVKERCHEWEIFLRGRPYTKIEPPVDVV
jgi:hypothetical protein